MSDLQGKVKKVKKLFDYPLRVEGEIVKAQEIGSDRIQQIIANLKETLINSRNGVGLSSHQIGIPIRIFIAVDEIFINAEIVSKGEEIVESREGCLSVPNAVRIIERNKEIEIRYFDEDGNQKVSTFDGLKAIVIQHELDHSVGKLIHDNR